jgi:membrane-associated phospholipid phosphatase
VADEQLTSLAAFIGGHALLLLAGLAALLIGTVLLVLAIGRWVHGHRLDIWERAKRAWARIAHLPLMQRLHVHLPAVWRVVKRLTPRGLLLLQLALGFVLSVAAIGFLGLARDIAGGAPLAHFDQALADALHRDATPGGVRFFAALTALGTGAGVAVVGLVVAIALLNRGRRLASIIWVLALAGSGLLNGALKAFYQRARPSFADPYAIAGSYSFPSGHAMMSVVAAGMLAYLIVVFRRSGPVQLAAIAAAIVWALLIGFSRLYLGVHYFSDVLGGYAAGTVWLTVCIAAMETVRSRRRTRDA